MGPEGSATIGAARTRDRWAWIALALFCVGSRFATGIYYVEDPDSLRFALAVADGFSLADLQPHFPGYPVFWFVGRIVYGLTRSLGATFALVGGLSTFALCVVLLRAMDWRPTEPAGVSLAVLVGFNPLVWLMGTRYMPDLSGLIVAVAGFALLTGRAGPPGWNRRLGWLSAGLLAGWRLSYLPILLVPLALEAYRGRVGLRHVVWGAGGVLVWLVPMGGDAGWTELWRAGWTQTEGHFAEFGGTVATRPDLGDRAAAFVRSVWADGLGGWWPGRSPVTVLVGLGWLGVLGIAAARVRSRRDASGISAAGRGRVPAAAVVLAAVLVYGAWTFFFQNVIHKPRHVLPLLVPLFLAGALGAAVLWKRGEGYVRRLIRGALVAVALGYAVTAGVLAMQHRSPSAPAQVREHVGEIARTSLDPVRIVSIPLVNYYLAGQGVRGEYLSIRDSIERRRARADLDRGTTLYVGRGAPAGWGEPARSDTFYHNPFVNRMWSRMDVYVYPPPRDDE